MKDEILRKHILIIVALVVFLTNCSPQPTVEVLRPTILAPSQQAQATAVEENLPTETAFAKPSATLPVENPTLVGTEAPAEPILGIQIDNISNPDQVALLARPERLWTRFEKFRWDAIEPQMTDPPTYDWSKVDEAALKNLGSSGIRAIAIIHFTPDWAQKFPPSACGPIAEGALDRFGQFLFTAASRFSQPPYNLHHWELGNEPDVDYRLIDSRSVFGCWGDQKDQYYGGGYYAEMLKVAYPQIKAADPLAKVMIGGLLLDCDPNNPPIDPGTGDLKNCTPARFLEGILANGGGDYFDGVSFHSYDYYLRELGKYGNGNWASMWNTTGPVLLAKTRFLRDILASYGYTDKFLINTELALICGKDGKEPECKTEEYSKTKAYYMAQASAAGLSLGLSGNVWYSLKGWRGSALVGNKLKPNQALEAFEFTLQQQDGAVFLNEITSYAGVLGYEFQKRDGTRVWLLWSLDGEAHLISLPSSPQAIFDVFGESLPVSQEISITVAPFYVEWTP